MTINSGDWGKYFDGNSILLQINKKTYIYIGWNIYSFETKNNIIKFISPIGNSDVSYAFAVDDKGLIYLMNDNVILTNVPKNKDPYIFFYKNINNNNIKKFKIKIIANREI